MSLAVYTTIYPGVEPYLESWCQSLRRQTDQSFQLWIGLDSVRSEAIRSMLGSDLEVHWVPAPPGATPAEIRQAALARLTEVCSKVVLVDSDDVLHPLRVASARAMLETSELAGCAMRLVDKAGKNLGLTFRLPSQLGPESVLPGQNVFGFSNSAFRSDLLRRCLPIPANSVLVDWFLATRAWLLGAKLAFDSQPRMQYRQHPANTARVRPPFSRRQVISDTALVRKHFQLLPGQPSPDFDAGRAESLRRVSADVEDFYQRVVIDPPVLDEYLDAVNNLESAPVWWSCVANPALAHIWRDRESWQ